MALAQPAKRILTFIFPVVLITIFGALFHSGGGTSYFYGLSALQYYVSTIAALSVVGSCYSQLAIVLAMRRQDGILKRVRATRCRMGATSWGSWRTASWSA